MPTYNVKNTNCTNKGRDFRLANKRRIAPRGTEKTPQVDQRQGELFYIDQYILNENKTRQKNLTMAWIDYKKTYDILP